MTTPDIHSLKLAIRQLILAGNHLADNLTCGCGGDFEPVCSECLHAAKSWEKLASDTINQLNASVDADTESAVPECPQESRVSTLPA